MFHETFDFWVFFLGKLQLFNKELAANNKEENEAKAKLIFDTNCINDQIVKSKQDVIIQYVKTIQKKSVNAGEILQAIQWISQIFNEDRMYKLQQYEYFLNRNSSKTGNISEELFEYLKDLNKVMNESLVLLDYLPEVAAKFGFARSQFILKPIVSKSVSSGGQRWSENCRGAVQAYYILETDIIKDYSYSD